VTRNLSAGLKRQLFTPYRDEDVRFLITADHASFDDPFRFVSGTPYEFETLTSNGEVFQCFPFSITLLSDDDSEPTATLRIQNVDDRIGSILLALPDEALSVTIQVVMTSTPDVIEYEATGLELVDVEVNAMVVSGKLTMRGAGTEPCPGRVLTKRISPVMHR
jgi:Domain of unknown function (DUF1833)